MKRKVVVEIRGGAFVGLYASDPDIDTYLVDWDEIAEHPESVKTRMQADPLAAMRADTKDIVARARRIPKEAARTSESGGIE